MVRDITFSRNMSKVTTIYKVLVVLGVTRKFLKR